MISLTTHFRILAAPVLALAISGCGSMVGHHKVEDFDEMPIGAVPVRTYEASSAEVKQAVLYSMQQTGLENIEEHETGDADLYITGEVGYSWRSNGQFVRIAARAKPESNSPQTDVFYTSIKRYEINVTEDLGVIREKLLNYIDSYIESL